MEKYSQKSMIGKVYLTILEKRLLAKGDRVIVGLSGGADSVALLVVLLKLKEKLSLQISACHFNHRLRGAESDDDEKFVKSLCHKLEVPLITGRAGESNLFKNEDEARRARYTFFEKILKEGRGDKVAIAHNLNDQAETVLMRLIRGTGIRGLKSIPYKRKKFVRPLLDIPRIEIEDFLRVEGISFVVDRTNFSLNYLRNDIRLNLIPFLSKRNPNILVTLANISKNASSDYDFIEEAATKEMKKIITEKYDNKIVLDYIKWLELHPSLRAMVIRLGLSDLATLDNITQKHLDEAVSLLEKGIGKKHKRLPHSLRIELVGGKIVLLKN